MGLKSAFRRVFAFFVKRPLQQFNIENRVGRELDKPRRPVAPRHPTSEPHFRKIVEEHPEIKQDLEKKSDDLMQRLKQINIKADKPLPELKTDPSKMPKDRTPHSIPVFGVLEPTEVPKGKLSMSQVLEVLINYRDKPDTFTKEYIANHYSLEIDKVNALVSHFGLFKLYEPKEDKKKTGRQSAAARLISGHQSNKFFSELPKDEGVKKKPGEP